MDIKRANKALERVAQNQNTTVECVIREIEVAMAEAMATADPQVLECWRRIPCAGECPSAAELVAYLAGILQK